MKAKLILRFRVDGTPQSRGSKKAITVPGKRRGLLIDDNAKSGPWMDLVAGYARKVMNGREPWDGPLCLKATFFRERPKGHFRKDGRLKPTAAAFPATKPDASKYMRAVEDALSKIVYVDDSRLVDSWPSKRWGKPGVVIELYQLPETMRDLQE